MKHTLGQSIRRARTIAGLSQTQLSELTGITQPDISGYETGATEPQPSNLFKIARATNTDHYPLCWWFTPHNDNT